MQVINRRYMIKLLQKLLGIENFEYRLRRLERAQYWREKYRH